MWAQSSADCNSWYKSVNFFCQLSFSTEIEFRRSVICDLSLFNFLSLIWMTKPCSVSNLEMAFFFVSSPVDNNNIRTTIRKRRHISIGPNLQDNTYRSFWACVIDVFLLTPPPSALPWRQSIVVLALIPSSCLHSCNHVPLTSDPLRQPWHSKWQVSMQLAPPWVPPREPNIVTSMTVPFFG